MSIRKLWIPAIAGAMLGTLALGTSAKADGTVSVTIGQGGSYSIPAYPTRTENAPYALTGSQQTLRNAPVVYQNFGQGQIVIPDVVGR